MSRALKYVTGPRHAPGWLLATALLAMGATAIFAAAPAEPTAAEAGAAAPAAPKTPEAPKLTVLQLALKGGFFMIPLALCSVAAVTVIIERLLALRHAKIIPPAFAGGLRAAFRSPSDREAALEYCRAQNSPVARVVGAGISKAHRGEEAVEAAIEDAGANEVAKLSRNLRFLYGIAAVAPMLGLLGTVSGMITAFRVTSVIIGPEKSLMLAKGIYEALITTYAGLCIAIPVLIAYYYFQGKIDRLISEMNDVSLEVVQQCAAAPAASGANSIAQPALATAGA